MMGTKTCPACYEGAVGKLCKDHRPKKPVVLRFEMPMRLTESQKSQMNGRMHSALYEETNKLLEEERTWRLRSIYQTMVRRHVHIGFKFQLRLPDNLIDDQLMYSVRAINHNGHLDCNYTDAQGVEHRVIMNADDIQVMRMLMPLILGAVS